MSAVKTQLVDPVAPISCHAWSPDRSSIAISPNTESVEVFTVKAGAYTKTHTLTEHSHHVTGIDWAPKTNRIVTCAQDRNAYVWVLEDNVWKPTLVILRINRAATCVKWSPDETKFAVGSGARLVSVCYFEEENDWWVAKHIKNPIRSTVLSLDWHPESILIAAGSADFKARVFSGYVKEIDKKPAANVWGAKLPFAELLAEFDSAGGWVHDVAFSASGEQLAFVAHDSSITVVNAAQSLAVARVELADLPFRSLTWITPSSLVAVGYDYFPVLFTYTGSALVRAGKLDVPEKKATGTLSAKDKFQTLDRKGQGALDAAAAGGDEITSTHQNVIGQVSIHTGTRNKATTIATTGMDGVLVLWDVAKAAAAASLTIA